MKMAPGLASIVAVWTASVAVTSAVQARPVPAAKGERIDPVAVVGCLHESTPNVWVLVDASEPVSSTANAPSAKELAALPKGGKRTFQLAGVTIYNLPAQRGHTVVVKGLPIQAKPADRLNVTSVTTIARTCVRPPAFN